jgi:hypothetical protein
MSGSRRRLAPAEEEEEEEEEEEPDEYREVSFGEGGCVSGDF